ncbi:MAG TPA: hypothetical protein VHW74_18100 [Mycobacteriales bacterium]|jgi:hypothetical protein|nr:hypothetical protein [Mycobacteriales bacterium]
MRAGIRLATAAFAIGVAIAPAAAAHGVAAGSGRAVKVFAHPAKSGPKVLHPLITAGAWYQPDPLCATPLGCGFIPLPALSPYPKGTYHVGTAVGRQTARAFIAVNLGPQAANASDGTLSIPLDTSLTDGSLDPQAAKVNVCVTYQAVVDVEGAFDNAPSANCLPAAHAKYVAKPTPHLVANLRRIAHGLSGVKGFALLPADAAPTTAWQIAFKLPTASTSGPKPTLSLVIGAVHHVVSKPTKTHHAGKGDKGAQPDTGPDLGAGVPAPTLPSTTETVPPSNQQPVIAQPTTRLRHLVTVGYQYPEVWLLPLALIVLIPFTIRALTKDLTRNR